MSSNNKLQERYEEISNALSKLSKEWKNKFNKLPQEYIELTKEIEQIKMYAELYQQYEAHNQETGTHFGIEKLISEKGEKTYTQLIDKLNKPLFIQKLTDKVYRAIRHNIDFERYRKYGDACLDNIILWDNAQLMLELRNDYDFQEKLEIIESYFEHSRKQSDAVDREVYWLFYEKLKTIEDAETRHDLIKEFRENRTNKYLDNLPREEIISTKLGNMVQTDVTDQMLNLSIDISSDDYLFARDRLNQLITASHLTRENKKFIKDCTKYAIYYTINPAFQKLNLNPNCDLGINQQKLESIRDTKASSYDKTISQTNTERDEFSKEYKTTPEKLAYLRRAIFQQYTNKVLENEIEDKEDIPECLRFNSDDYLALTILEDMYSYQLDIELEHNKREDKALFEIAKKLETTPEELYQEGKVKKSEWNA